MNERLERFTGLLRGIFELDKSDLDFGIYRILNIRKAEIEHFLTEGLQEKVREALAPFAANTGVVEKRIAEIEAQCEAVGVAVPNSRMAEEYTSLKSTLAAGGDLSALEADVYSALYSFFNRYYEEGDFISKRRYKEGVYAIPYEGEEIKLYWANQDQYYVKTSENFKDYTFHAKDAYGDGCTVHFRLTDATTEQDNNKEADDGRRVFMLYPETEAAPGLKTFEWDEKTRELTIRFVYDIPAEKKKKYEEETYTAICDWIVKEQKELIPVLLAEVSADPKKKLSLLQKHLKSYAAKNTFDYFIHKDLKGFLYRELNFYIKSEVVHLEDLDTTDEQRAETYLAKVKAIRRVGHMVIDFLAQIEEFQKKLWLKKKFVVRTDWCLTLDQIDESFWPEIAANQVQTDEWIRLYAIDETGASDSAAGWTNPPTMDFLRQNQNLIVDTKHFSTDFKERVIACVDDLEAGTDGLLIHADNFQALNLLQKRYAGCIDTIHIDPPYNTDTSGFLYKNNYRHSSWASMMFDRITLADRLLEHDEGAFQCHIDENEYELLHGIFDMLPRQDAGTIVWNKLNPMLGRKGVATQHEYVIFRSNQDASIYAKNDNIEKIFAYAREAIAENGGINADARSAFASTLSKDASLSGGDRAYHFIDDEGNVYRQVAMGAPEKRTDPKYYIPLIHSLTGKACPVPSNGWSRKPETMQDMLRDGTILFGRDEKTQPQKKVILSKTGQRQIPSVLSEGKSGKADLDRLGLDFPYAHPVSMYETLISANGGTAILDFFAGSGTTGHAAINLNRSDGRRRRYILVEMGNYFDEVTIPRLKKAVYAAEWKNGRPLSRSTGVSQRIKYMSLESYEDALSNIERSEEALPLLGLLGDDYLIHYMLDTETEGSLLKLGRFKQPFDYRMKINEHNETRDTVVDLAETFNYLIGLSVIRQSAVTYFRAEEDSAGVYEGAVRLFEDGDGEFGFKRVEGTLPDGQRALVIWRTVTDDLLKSNAALDAYFHVCTSGSSGHGFDIIFVNGDNNLENLRTEDEGWKVNMTETVFKRRMFEDEGDV